MWVKDLNNKVFFKINSLQGKNVWADAFGRAGAEWVIFAMAAWYAVSDYIVYHTSRLAFFWPLLFVAAAWGLGWVINLTAAALVREPRPKVSQPGVKLLFEPLANWKSFPSDHAMTAFLIFFMALVFALPGAWSLLPLAVWVAWGRVYSGVHYPGDILAGIAVAGIVAVSCQIVLNSVL